MGWDATKELCRNVQVLQKKQPGYGHGYGYGYTQLIFIFNVFFSHTPFFQFQLLC